MPGRRLVPRSGDHRWRDVGRTVAVSGLALVTALAVGAVIIVLSDEQLLTRWGYLLDRPGDALGGSWRAVSAAYGALLAGSIGGPRALSETLVSATPLILAGLAVALPFRAGLFNIGGEGQVLAGGLLAGYVGFTSVGLPSAVVLPLAVLGGAVGGAAYGAVPGWLKARTGAHEVITTIMLNYVAANLTLLLITSAAFRRPDRTDAISRPVDEAARLPLLFGSGYRVHAGILLAVAAAAGVAWLLHRTTLGFEFRAVGLNQDAARAAGMSVTRTWVASMTSGGGLAGLGGAAIILGVQFSLTPGFSAGIGFEGITVALLGRGTPWGTVAAGVLFGALRAGGLRMQAETGVSVDLVVVLQALIILFVAAPALIRALYRLRAPGAAEAETVSTGWGA